MSTLNTSVCSVSRSQSYTPMIVGTRRSRIDTVSVTTPMLVIPATWPDLPGSLTPVRTTEILELRAESPRMTRCGHDETAAARIAHDRGRARSPRRIRDTGDECGSGGADHYHEPGNPAQLSRAGCLPSDSRNGLQQGRDA